MKHAPSVREVRFLPKSTPAAPVSGLATHTVPSQHSAPPLPKDSRHALVAGRARVGVSISESTCIESTSASFPHLGVVRVLAHGGDPIIRVAPHGYDQGVLCVVTGRTRLRGPTCPLAALDTLAYPTLKPVLQEPREQVRRVKI